MRGQGDGGATHVEGLSPADAFLEAIVGADRARARTLVLEELARSGDTATMYATFVQEALYRVGRGWQAGELTVAQEHAATATVQYLLSSLYMELPRSTIDRGTAVIAGLPGEWHQLGAHMVADVLDSDGWRVHFLGTDVPTAALLATIEEHDVDLVGLSMTMPSRLPTLAASVAELRRRFGSAVRVIVGGQGKLGVDVKELGADAYANDVVAARDVARALEKQ